VGAIGSNGRATATVGVALCAGLLAGCGGSSDAGGSDGPGGSAAAPSTTVTVPALPADLPQKPACALVTRAEVEAAIGARVGEGKEEAQPGRSACTFLLVSDSNQRIGIVSTSSSGVPAFVANARERVTTEQTVRAGDEAFVNGGLGIVRRGNTMVTIVVALRQEQPALAAAATKLALAAGARL
jgi:hypothetical protein